MKSIILALSCSFIATNAFSQTTISSSIYSTTTFTKANSPYIIQGNIVVFSGADLIIEPGTSLQFEDNASIELRGNLKAIGTETDSIIFTSNNPSPLKGIFKGINIMTNSSVPFGQSTNQITMGYCIVSYASNFLQFSSAFNGPYTFDKCRFSNNVYVNQEMRTSSNKITFTNCMFTNNDYALYGGGEDGPMYITNCTFLNNKQGSTGGHVDNCVYMGNTDYGAYMYEDVVNSYFSGNNIGIKADHHHDTKVMNNSIFNNNIGVVIDRMWIDPNIIFKYNRICSNTQWNVRYDYTGNADLTDNCWCTHDSAAIRSKIRDGYSDPAFGLTTFSYDDSCFVYSAPALGIPVTDKKIENTSISIAPNPSSGIANITFNTTEGNTYSLLINDITGRQVAKVNTVVNGQYTLNTNDMRPGLYVVSLYNNDRRIGTSRLIVR